MARVDEVRPWNLPLGFSTSKEGKPKVQDVIDWSGQNDPNGFQKLTYLTIGSMFATLFGAVISVGRDNKSGSLFGAVLALCGIGGTICGFIFAPDYKEEKKSDEIASEQDPEIRSLLEKLNNVNYDYRVRAQAAYELGKKKAKSAVEDLIQCLKDKTLTVKKKAAEALGEIGDSKALQALQESISKQFTKGWKAFQKVVNEAIRKLQPGK